MLCASKLLSSLNYFVACHTPCISRYAPHALRPTLQSAEAPRIAVLVMWLESAAAILRCLSALCCSKRNRQQQATRPRHNREALHAKLLPPHRWTRSAQSWSEEDAISYTFSERPSCARMRCSCVRMSPWRRASNLRNEVNALLPVIRAATCRFTLSTCAQAVCKQIDNCKLSQRRSKKYALDVCLR